MLTRAMWLKSAEAELRDARIDSARLDAELILTHALNLKRTALHAHPDEPIPDAYRGILEAMLGLRVIRVPLAYIVGHREFYGRLFKVTPSVLIPRPETEDLVTIAKELLDAGAPATLIDVGTGSGALAVTLALEFPNADVLASDISTRALSVAEGNAATYGVAVEFRKSDMLADVPLRGVTAPILVLANLPYVALADDRSPETKYEPEDALFAADEGLELIRTLITECAEKLNAGDYLLLESNPGQQPAIIAHAKENGFALERTHHLVTVLRRN